MKILILADVNDFHWHGETSRVDLVISCGDIFDGYLLEAAKANNCSRIYAVKGNHDSIAPFLEPILDIHLKTEKYCGITFGGLNGSWKYKPKGNFLYEQGEVEHFLECFPKVNVFISHNSPKGIHDKEDEVHCGFEALNKYIQLASPNLLIHGHQHINQETRSSNTIIIGIYGHKLIEYF